MQSTLEWMFDHPWIIELVFAALILFFLHIVLKKILLHSKKMAKLEESDWRFHLDYTAVTPMRVLLWILLIAFAVDLITREFGLSGSFSYIAPVCNAAIVFCLAWFSLRLKKVFHKVISMRPDRGAKGRLMIDPFTVEVIGKIFTISVVFITLLIVLQIFGLNVVPLVAFGGIGAATLGIAGKDVISNFFGGFMIYLTRPFLVGDLIELPQRKISGHIEEIGWYLTSIRDLQKKSVYIPNAVFSNELLINQSRITHRRIEESIGVRYEDLDKIPSIIEEIRTLFKHHSSIDHRQSVYIFLEHFGDYCIRLEVKAYVLSTRYDAFMEIRQSIMTQICQIIEKAGAEMPPPMMKIKMIETALH